MITSVLKRGGGLDALSVFFPKGNLYFQNQKRCEALN